MKLSLSLSTLFGECDRISPALSARKQRKVRRNLKTLSNHLSNYGLISLKWAQFGYFNGLLLVFRHGTISSICFAPDGTITNVYHENYLHNRLASHRVSSIEIQDQYILVSYIEPYLTCISLKKNFDRSKQYLKFKLKSSCAIRTVNFDRCQQHRQPVLSKHNLTVSSEHILLWWNTALYFNWTLPNSDTQAPNLLLMEHSKLSVLATETIDGDIIKNCFVEHEPTKFGILFRPSNISFCLSYQVYQVVTSSVDSNTTTDLGESVRSPVKLEIVFSATIPLDKSCIYAEFTKLQDKILLLCDDESVTLFNIEQNVLYSLHSSMPICYLASNPLDAIFVTCNQFGRLSIYDFAFNHIEFEVLRKDSSVSCLTENGDIGVLSSEGMTIKRLQFLTPQLLILLLVDNKRQDAKSNTSAISNSPSTQRSPCQLLLLNLPHPVDFKFLTHEYLKTAENSSAALNILQILNWNCASEQAYYCLNAIFQYFLKLPLDSELESRIESTLASFLIPHTPIDHKIFEQILPFVRHLAVRFFFHLIRHRSYAKAYQLGIELKSRRHFMLLYEITKQNGLHLLARASYRQAQLLT